MGHRLEDLPVVGQQLVAPGGEVGLHALEEFVDGEEAAELVVDAEHGHVGEAAGAGAFGHFMDGDAVGGDAVAGGRRLDFRGVPDEESAGFEAGGVVEVAGFVEGEDGGEGIEDGVDDAGGGREDEGAFETTLRLAWVVIPERVFRLSVACRLAKLDTCREMPFLLSPSAHRVAPPPTVSFPRTRESRRSRRVTLGRLGSRVRGKDGGGRRA